MDRRDFLTKSVFAATAGLALDACAPESTQLIPILIPEEPFVPGEETWLRSTCFSCAALCGLSVRKIDGRLVKVEGNPDHPVSRGGVCARGQALPQAMYHPDRIQSPLAKQSDGSWGVVSWDDALSQIARALDGEPRVAFVTGEMTGHRRSIVERFVQAFGGEHVVHDAFPAAAAHPPIDDASYVVSFGAELLEAASPVRYGRALTELRHGRPGRRGKLVMVGPRLSLTGANADEWVPARPGEELDIALGVAHVLMRELPDASGIDPERVPPGAARPDIERLAREMAAHRPAIAIAGAGAPIENAVALVNRLLGNRTGATPEPPFAPWPSLEGDPAPTRTLQDVVGGETPSVLFVADTNPVYSMPESAAWLDAAPLRVSFASILDETADACDWILPESALFERFEDAVPPGSAVAAASLTQPMLARPLYDTRSMPDALIALAKAAGRDDAFPWSTYQEALEAAWSGLDISWSAALAKGGFWADTPAERSEPTLDLAALARGDASVTERDELLLHVYASTPFGDGRSAALPFLQELSDPVTGVRWGSVVEISTDTGAALGVESGDHVELTTDRGSATLPALVTEGIHPGVVALAAGQGHTSFGRYANGRGVNAFALLDRAGPTPVQIRKVRG